MTARSFLPRDPDFETIVRASFARQNLMTSMRAQLCEISPGYVEITAPISPDFTQQHGFAHAGLTFALGDTAAGYAALSLMETEQEVLTVEMKINLLAPGRGDRLIAAGTVVKPGRRLIVARADVTAEAGGARTPIATLLGTMIPV